MICQRVGNFLPTSSTIVVSGPMELPNNIKQGRNHSEDLSGSFHFRNTRLHCAGRQGLLRRFCYRYPHLYGKGPKDLSRGFCHRHPCLHGSRQQGLPGQLCDGNTCVYSRKMIKETRLFEPAWEEKRLILAAMETVQIIGQGYYKKGERQISLSDGSHQNFSLAVSYSPKVLEGMRINHPANRYVTTCKIQVADCDSLEAAAGLDTPLVMNFADALTPGGRFLYGAATQEESLCRTSTLYASLTSPEAAEMYRYHRKHPSPTDSDYMLLSPEVCVFRDAKGQLLDQPYFLAVISAAAPDRRTRAAMISQEKLDGVIKRRLRNLFTVAALHGYRSLVLGAWGCGAFGNDTGHVAECFYELLVEEGYAGLFGEVTFAILHDCAKRKIFQGYFSKI